MSKKPPAVVYGAATGIPLARPDRNQSTETLPPAGVAGAGDRRTEIFTYFTKAGLQPAQGGTPILYNGDRQWAEVTLTLETAGPVAVGTRADLFPVLSGRGELLTTNIPATFVIAKGDSRLYIASTSVNRVKVEIAPYAWLESISANVESVVKLLQTLNAVVAHGNQK